MHLVYQIQIHKTLSLELTQLRISLLADPVLESTQYIYWSPTLSDMLIRRTSIAFSRTTGDSKVSPFPLFLFSSSSHQCRHCDHNILITIFLIYLLLFPLSSHSEVHIAWTWLIVIPLPLREALGPTQPRNIGPNPWEYRENQLHLRHLRYWTTPGESD